MTDDREQRIRERAHALWEAEGRPEGRHEHHWRQASQEVGEEMFDPQGASDGQDRPGALDGGLLPEGGLVAGGGPAGLGLGGLGVTGSEPDEEDRTGVPPQG
ncbi:DUF2934 domain-containing protein [Rubellimicrobium roseum]|uniref:DUF2934 domain-containing protein n=1 Tax=Rubellimicrobium roseum TaxID=687525 RepID=UPI001C3F2922|nr:DUF2934 domain-containing protein [Rubellimicrobium roseum]